MCMSFLRIGHWQSVIVDQIDASTKVTRALAVFLGPVMFTVKLFIVSNMQLVVTT